MSYRADAGRHYAADAVPPAAAVLPRRKATGENLTRLRGEYRQQLTSWLQGQAELTIFGASQRYRARMESTELNWHEAQRRQSELTAFSQALMMLIGGFAVVAMLWMASGGVAAQPGALIALFVFCALAAFEALAPVTGAFQHLGQVIASALRITQITEQEPEVQFQTQQTAVPAQVALQLQDITFAYAGQTQNALEGINLSVSAGARIALLGRTGCGKSTLLQLLTRAWDPQHGNILFNDVPLREFSEHALRKTVSVVPQRVHLFSATLRDNLRLAAPEASDDVLSAMLERLGCTNCSKMTA
jgi:ATP-binding cassette subfamily C protein CydC